ncbi:hypothetical protein CBOM_06147 [Ceraceosorus bombacis]|uniref:Uncharacterized protein n=1 Tax=Ceraceosorus bombacis TaxID=401625 RepID=A0A0N7LAD6_9BASI|nr:hypothetical protein CBOM_06147 [Ceraceosorus bombacis]
MKLIFALSTLCFAMGCAVAAPLMQAFDPSKDPGLNKFAFADLVPLTKEKHWEPRKLFVLKPNAKWMHFVTDDVPPPRSGGFHGDRRGASWKQSGITVLGWTSGPFAHTIGSAFALPLILSPTIDGNPVLDKHAFGTRWDEPVTSYMKPGGTPSLTDSLLLSAKIAGSSGGKRAGQMEEKRLQEYADSCPLGSPGVTPRILNTMVVKATHNKRSIVATEKTTKKLRSTRKW